MVLNGAMDREELVLMPVDSIETAATHRYKSDGSIGQEAQPLPFFIFGDDDYESEDGFDDDSDDDSYDDDSYDDLEEDDDDDDEDEYDAYDEYDAGDEDDDDDEDDEWDDEFNE